jgi:hypothetical protein
LVLTAGSEVLADSWLLLIPVLSPLGEVPSVADDVGLASAVAEGLPLSDGALALAE